MKQFSARSLSIRVHGRGPLSDVVVSALRCSGARVRHTNQRGATGADADLVVLTDYLVVDPALVRELHAAGTPHLLVRVRDGAGLVGPISEPKHMITGGINSAAGAWLVQSQYRAPAFMQLKAYI